MTKPTTPAEWLHDFTRSSWKGNTFCSWRFSRTFSWIKPFPEPLLFKQGNWCDAQIGYCRYLRIIRQRFAPRHCTEKGKKFTRHSSLGGCTFNYIPEPLTSKGMPVRLEMWCVTDMLPVTDSQVHASPRVVRSSTCSTNRPVIMGYGSNSAHHIRNDDDREKNMRLRVYYVFRRFIPQGGKCKRERHS